MLRRFLEFDSGLWFPFHHNVQSVPRKFETIVCVSAAVPTCDMKMFMQFVVAPCEFRLETARAIRRSASLVTGNEQGLAVPGAEANSRCLP
jgi:hypothetical protein